MIPTEVGGGDTAMDSIDSEGVSDSVTEDGEYEYSNVCMHLIEHDKFKRLVLSSAILFETWERGSSSNRIMNGQYSLQS